jgi:isopentenyldiphosphate isomerase
MSYRVGFGRGGQLYTRARYSEGQNYGTDGKLAYFSELHYYSGDKFGAELNARYTHTFSETQALEFSNSFRYRDKRKDWFWRHELKYLHMLDANQSLLFTAMIDGLNKPSYRSEQKLLSVRYKRNILRPWLFIEVEPFMLWLREEDFRTSYGLALRLEVHFPDKSLLY